MAVGPYGTEQPTCATPSLRVRVRVVCLFFVYGNTPICAIYVRYYSIAPPPSLPSQRAHLVGATATARGKWATKRKTGGWNKTWLGGVGKRQVDVVGSAPTNGDNGEHSVKFFRLVMCDGFVQVQSLSPVAAHPRKTFKLRPDRKVPILRIVYSMLPFARILAKRQHKA